MAAGAPTVEIASFPVLSLIGAQSTRTTFANLCGQPPGNLLPPKPETTNISLRVTYGPCARTMIPASTIHEENNMGILDTISQLAGQAGDAAQGDQAKVAGGFIQALTAHPEGIQGVLDSLKANGMADHIGSWLSGQA